MALLPSPHYLGGTKHPALVGPVAHRSPLAIHPNLEENSLDSQVWHAQAP